MQFIHSSANKRVQRWAIALSEFHFDIVYSPGQGNEIADMLSRLLPDTSEKEEEHEHVQVVTTRQKISEGGRVTVTETQQPPEPEPEPKQIELNETLKKLTLSIESRTVDNVLILKKCTSQYKTSHQLFRSS